MMKYFNYFLKVFYGVLTFSFYVFFIYFLLFYLPVYVFADDNFNNAINTGKSTASQLLNTWKNQYNILNIDNFSGSNKTFLKYLSNKDNISTYNLQNYFGNDLNDYVNNKISDNSTYNPQNDVYKNVENKAYEILTNGQIGNYITVQSTLDNSLTKQAMDSIDNTSSVVCSDNFTLVQTGVQDQYEIYTCSKSFIPAQLECEVNRNLKYSTEDCGYIDQYGYCPFMWYYFNDSDKLCNYYVFPDGGYLQAFHNTYTYDGYTCKKVKNFYFNVLYLCEKLVHNCQNILTVYNNLENQDGLVCDNKTLKIECLEPTPDVNEELMYNYVYNIWDAQSKKCMIASPYSLDQTCSPEDKHICSNFITTTNTWEECKAFFDNETNLRKGLREHITGDVNKIIFESIDIYEYSSIPDWVAEAGKSCGNLHISTEDGDHAREIDVRYYLNEDFTVQADETIVSDGNNSIILPPDCSKMKVTISGCHFIDSSDNLTITAPIENYNTCEVFENDSNCELIGSECLKDDNGTDIVDEYGNCLEIEYTYKCKTGNIKKYKMVDTKTCTGTVNCIGTQCTEEIQVENNEDMNRALTDLETMKQINRSMNVINGYSDNVKIFQGRVKKCKKYPKFGVNCCKANVSSSDIADYIKAFQVTYRVAKQAGLFDKIYNDISSKAVKQFMLKFNFVGGIEEQIAMQAIYEHAGNFILNVFGEDVFKSIFEYSIDGSGNLIATGLNPALSTALSVVGWAVTAYQVMKLIISFIAKCDQSDAEATYHVKLGNCHYVGTYCAKKVKFIGCIKKKKVYCCYDQIFDRIFWEQLRKTSQPALVEKYGSYIMSWGSAKSPNCGYMTPEMLQYVDMSNFDFSEWIYKQLSVNGGKRISGLYDLQNINEVMDMIDVTPETIKSNTENDINNYIDNITNNPSSFEPILPDSSIYILSGQNQLETTDTVQGMTIKNITVGKGLDEDNSTDNNTDNSTN